MKNGPETRIPTNLRMLKILEELSDSSGAVSSPEIGKRLGLPKPTVHRLCNTLVEEGYLLREGRSGFRPSRKAREMASAILHGPSAHIARRQVLEALAQEIGETVNFVVPEDRGMSYKDRVETNWAFRIQLPIGSHVPFHATASGKAFLAALKKSERQRLVNVMNLERFTRKTRTNPDKLLDELAEIARQGYALDDEEFMDGMVAAAVPVHNPSGRYFASLAFHGPVQRVTIKRAIELVPTLQEAAKKVQEALF